MNPLTSDAHGGFSVGIQSNRATAVVSGAHSSYSTTFPQPAQVATVAVPLWVPSELERIPQWVCWRYGLRDGKPTKIPVNPRTGGNAKTDTPSTWAVFDVALEYYHTHPQLVSGVGLVLRDTPIVAVDLDKCIADGIIQPWAMRIIKAFNSYTEVSPSGSGLRLFAVGRKPGGNSKLGDVELYDATSTRYVSFTGRHLPGTPLELTDATTAVAELYNELWPAKPTAAHTPAPTQPLDIDDTELLARAMTAKNGHRFSELWRGSTVGYSSASEADYALVGALLFWTAGDEKRVDALFRRSGLYRDKWDVRHSGDGLTYGSLTIHKCAAGQTRYYTPTPPKPANVTSSGEVTQPIGVADVWRILHKHVTHDGERCPMCGRLWTEEWEVGDTTHGRFRLFRCKRADCLDWQTHRAKQLVVQSDMHLWPAHYVTKLPTAEYDKLVERGVLYRGDAWLSVLETDAVVFVASGFVIDARSIATRLDALAPMMALAWLSRKPGSRLRNPKKMARAKRAVACDAETPTAVSAATANTPEPEPEPKPTRRYAFGLVDLDFPQAHDFLSVLEHAGATVNHKRGSWMYRTAERATIAAIVNVWADVAGVGGRREIDALGQKTNTNASIPHPPAAVDVLSGDMHPDASGIARYMTARAVTTHGRRSK